MSWQAVLLGSAVALLTGGGMCWWLTRNDE